MATEKLITVFNYAQKIKASTTWVYRLIKENKIQFTEIDGVKFVKVNTQGKALKPE